MVAICFSNRLHTTMDANFRLSSAMYTNIHWQEVTKILINFTLLISLVCGFRNSEALHQKLPTISGHFLPVYTAKLYFPASLQLGGLANTNLLQGPSFSLPSMIPWKPIQRWWYYKMEDAEKEWLRFASHHLEGSSPGELAQQGTFTLDLRVNEK